MRKSYIFIYSEALGNYESIKYWLDNMSNIIDWRSDLPNTFYIISDADADTIATEIRRRLGNNRFLITEYSQNSQGWLNDDTWYLLNNSRRKPKT